MNKMFKKENEMTKAELMQILVDEEMAVEMLESNNEFEYLDCEYEVYTRPVAEDTNSKYIVFLTNLETGESDFRFFDNVEEFASLVEQIKKSI